MSALEFLSNNVAAAIELACRLHGRKRGEALAADLLGITERTVRAVRYGETNGASIPHDVAFNARMALRRQRAEQIRAELRQLEVDDAATAEGAGSCVGLGW